MRKWYKMISPKQANETWTIYTGSWMPHMDRWWESDDGYSVGSRLLRTDWGKVEHVTIQKMGSLSGDGSRDIPWAVKQEIKDELFGSRRVAIEVFPEDKHLVDVCDVYHLWVLPKDFKMPFGIHPTRDVQCPIVERGYDWDLEKAKEWIDNPERKKFLMLE